MRANALPATSTNTNLSPTHSTTPHAELPPPCLCFVLPRTVSLHLCLCCVSAHCDAVRAQYESLVRIAFAHCRLHHRTVVNIADVVAAIALTEQSHATRAHSTQSALRMANANSPHIKALTDFLLTSMPPSTDGRLAVERMVKCNASWPAPYNALQGFLSCLDFGLRAYQLHKDRLWEQRERDVKQARAQAEVEAKAKATEAATRGSAEVKSSRDGGAD